MRDVTAVMLFMVHTVTHI